MFNQIFGNYLVKSNILTANQLKEVIEYESTVRVKMGLIAVAEKMMTQAQADEVNRLQATMDKRFGDIAVMKGYLTDDNVTQLLKKQGNVYMLFCQTLVDKGYMDLDQIDQALAEYQKQEGFTHSDMDDLVSGDIDRTVRLFLPQIGDLNSELCAVMIRTIIRLIDNEAYVSKAYMTDSVEAGNFALQKMEGEHRIFAGFAGKDKELLAIANPFAKEEFEAVDLDALDAVGEFTNCVNGLLASDLSRKGVAVDMLPPEFYENPVTIKGNQICVFPVTVKEQQINFIMAVDSEITVE